YSSAMDAERRGDYDGALKLYVKAGSALLALGDRSAAARAIERAEKIQLARKDVTPLVRDRFSDEEQRRVLRKGSKVNDLSVPLWKESRSRVDDVEQFIDPRQPTLSEEQVSEGVTWKRPEEVFDDTSISHEELVAEDLVQRISDCTLHASVVVCLAHRRRFGFEAVIPRLLPADSEGMPKISSNGAYELCIYFNGGPRRFISITVFDSCLPFQPDGKLMCLAPKEAHNIWPSLIEKAYLKLFGSYNFLGSNSVADIHMLLGWIPEHIDLKRHTFQREQTWSRLVDAFYDGTGLITVGTDDRPPVRVSNFQPLQSHCYAITNVSPKGEPDRWLTILDSFGHSHQHEGPDTSYQQNSTNTVRMSFHDLCATFDSIYVSWDPRIFPQSLQYHGVWRASYMSEDDKVESSHQIFHLIIDPLRSGTNEVWILLTRHKTNTRLADEYISLQAELEDFIHSDSAASSTKTKGVYTDSPHILVRTLVPARGGILSVTASYDSHQNDVGYTLEVFSFAPARWDRTQSKLRYDDVIVSSVFNNRTAGGNHTLPTYMYNPQYKLTVPPSRTAGKPRVVLTVQTARDLPVNATVVWGKGERVFDLTKSDILASSGAYSYGFATTSKDLAPGTYTVVISAFEPTHLGPFSLKIASSVKTQLEPIPQEGSGMFAKPVRGEWFYHCRLYCLQEPQSLHRARLQLQEPSPSTAVCLALTGLGQQRFEFTSELTDAPAGAGIPLTTLRAGTYVLTPSAEGFGEGAKFRLMLWSDRAVVDLRPIP
ncbi:hypothetical protein K488DRAFT_44532, partial [Vararia minispora EC-137]